MITCKSHIRTAPICFLFGTELNLKITLTPSDFNHHIALARTLLETKVTSKLKSTMAASYEPFSKLLEKYKLDDFKTASTVAGGQRMSSGAVQMPYVVLSSPQKDFYAAAATWSTPFDWMKWSDTRRGKALVKGDPGSIEMATAEELQKLLTTWIRSDRFCEGAFAGFCEMGHAGRVLRRMRQLHEESRGSKNR